MKKIFVKVPAKSLMGQKVKYDIEALVLNKGHEVVQNENEASLVLRYIDKDKVHLYINSIKEGTTLFYLDENNEFKFVQKVSITQGSQEAIGSYFIKGFKEPTKVPYPATAIGEDEQLKRIAFYLLGKTSSCSVNNILHGKVILSLVRIMLLKDPKGTKSVAEKDNLAKQLEVSLEDLNVIADMVREATSFSDNKLVKLIRSVEYFYDHINETILNNVSDSIFVNLIHMYQFLMYALRKNGATDPKDIEKKNQFLSRYSEEKNAARKTIRESLTGSGAFKKYVREGMEQMGVYTLFIPNNNLGDWEIKVPHPRFLGNPDSYPKIGTHVINTRHPITTLVPVFKVVGYTEDCSVQVNAKVALALYGDADGDAQSFSWSEWTKGMRWASDKEIADFCNAADIILDDVTGKEFKPAELDYYLNLQPDTEEDCKIKSSASGLEQAEAKLVTKQVTGLFGATERDVAQTLIINNKDISMEMLHRKSWLSQIPVQAKNLLADLRSGKELDQLTKETLALFTIMQKDRLTAAKSISMLLGTTVEETVDLLADIFGDQTTVKVVDTPQAATVEDELKAMLNNF